MEPAHPTGQTRSLSLERRIDDACNRFEAAWKVASTTADAPRLEDFLTDTVEPDRSALLKELLPIEVHHRRRLGESPKVDAYQERFAGLDTLVVAHALGDTTINDTPVAGGTRLRGEQQLGEYEVLSELGRGGMGAVLLARDPHVKREVAIKVLLADHEHHPELVRRFFAEARIGGQLQHPGVVPVYELSRTEAPRPYFTMKRVEGRALATLLAERSSPDDNLPRFLRVFQQIAQTMAYAHSRGIVHRDLKPANVMVGDFGETLVVDWGLAKRLDQTTAAAADVDAVPSDAPDPTAETFVPTGSATDELTGEGRILGTLRYMSPEQATGASPRVGPATDVYSLGAILYEILAGRPPYHDVRGPELLASVQRSAPQPIVQVHRTVPKPLVAICERAMARRSEDRYATATELARDVERWLADEPVSAYADPWTVRARRWTRRHPAMTAAVAAAVLLGVGFLGVVALLVRAQNHELLEKNNQLVAANAKERQAKERALKAFEEVTSAGATAFVMGQAQHLSPEQRRFLQTVVRNYQEYAAETPETEAERARQAEAFSRMGVMQYYLGEKAAAEVAFRSAIGLYDQLAAEFPQTVAYREEGARGRNSFGMILEALGQRAKAEQVFRQSVATGRELASQLVLMPEQQRRRAAPLTNLAGFLIRSGQIEEGEPLFREALVILETLGRAADASPEIRSDLATAYLNLGFLQEARGIMDQAEAGFVQAIDVLQELIADHPRVPKYHLELVRAATQLGNTQRRLGKEASAIESLRRAVVAADKLVADHPAVPGYRQQSAMAHGELGRLLLDQPESDAEVLLRRAALLFEGLLADSPVEAEYGYGASESWSHLGMYYQDLGKFKEAEKTFRRGIAIMAPFVAKEGSAPDHRQALALCRINLAVLLGSRQWDQEAEEELRQAMPLLEKLCAEVPSDPTYTMHLAGCYREFGVLLRDTQRAAAAMDWHAKSIAALQPLLDRDPEPTGVRQHLRVAFGQRANTLNELTRYAEALADWDRALAVAKTNAPDLRVGRAYSLALLGAHAEAFKEVQSLTLARDDASPPNDLSGPSLQTLAGACARCAAAVGENEQLRGQYVTRCLDLLRQAARKGHAKPDVLEKDKDFEALRERSDFQALLKELKAKEP